MTVTGATMSYSIVYGPMVNYNVSAVDANAFTDEQLGNNAGAFTSVVALDLSVEYLLMPADMGSETLTIDFDGDTTTAWGLWYKRTAETPWTAVNHVTSAASAASGRAAPACLRDLRPGRSHCPNRARTGTKPRFFGSAALRILCPPCLTSRRCWIGRCQTSTRDWYNPFLPFCLGTSSLESTQIG